MDFLFFYPKFLFTQNILRYPNFFLVLYLLLLTVSKMELSLAILFLVAWPIHPFIITFFQIMRNDKLDEEHSVHEIRVKRMIMLYFKNLKSHLFSFSINHLVLFILVVDTIFLGFPAKLIFLLLLFIALALTLISHYLLAKEKISVTEVFKKSIELLYSSFFKNLSYLFFFLVILLSILWYAGPLISLLVFFLFLKLVVNYFDKTFVV